MAAEDHRLLPLVHPYKYRYEAHCSCGWSATRRLQGEAEEAHEEHVRRETRGR